MKRVTIATLAQGAAVEAVDHCIGEVVQNIQDPNTDAKKKRKVVLTLVFTPNEHRNMMDIAFEAQSKLVPAAPGTATAMLDTDEHGEIVPLELFQGQNPNQATLPVKGVEEYQPKDPKVVNIGGSNA